MKHVKKTKKTVRVRVRVRHRQREGPLRLKTLYVNMYIVYN